MSTPKPSAARAAPAGVHNPTAAENARAKAANRPRPEMRMMGAVRASSPTQMPTATRAIQKSTGGFSSPATPATWPSWAARPKSARERGVPLMAFLK